MIRAIASFLFFWVFYSAVLFGILFLAGWNGTVRNLHKRPRQYDTYGALKQLNQHLLEYRDEKNSYPESLKGDWAKEHSHFWSLTSWESYSPELGILDPWGTPFLYEIDGESVILGSLGRDKSPGGVGIDADIYANTPLSSIPPPTFEQFITERNKNEIQLNQTRLYPIVCGVLVLFMVIASSASALRVLYDRFMLRRWMKSGRSNQAKPLPPRPLSAMMLGSFSLFPTVDPHDLRPHWFFSVCAHLTALYSLVLGSILWAFIMSMLHAVPPNGH